MKLDRRIRDLLKQAGATLKRSKKHIVFGIPGNRNIVLSHSPSDVNAGNAAFHELKKVLGVEEKKHVSPAEKRNKPGRYGEPRPRPASPPLNPFADQLRAIGITETALRAEIKGLTDNVNQLKALRADCWLCRLRDWLRARRK